jgi:hypothetical protein
MLPHRGKKIMATDLIFLTGLLLIILIFQFLITIALIFYIRKKLNEKPPTEREIEKAIEEA